MNDFKIGTLVEICKKLHITSLKIEKVEERFQIFVDLNGGNLNSNKNSDTFLAKSLDFLSSGTYFHFRPFFYSQVYYFKNELHRKRFIREVLKIGQS
jgi:hypothetical protein